MEKFNSWTELFISSLQTFGDKVMNTFPSILGALFIFVLGWIFAKLISLAVSRILRFVKFNELASKVNATEYLKKANVTLKPSVLVGKFIYWIILLLVLITASDTLGWTSVSAEISKLISYLPQLLIAIVIFIIGTYIATFIRDVISGTTNSLGISTGKVISGFVFYLLFIVVTLTALRQAGVDTSIITSNMLLILGAILAAAAISYGFASREVLSNILAGYMGRGTYQKGMDIEIGEVRGIITGVSSIGVTLKSQDGSRTIVPAQKLITQNVKIY